MQYGECSGQRARGMHKGLALGDAGSSSVSTLQHGLTTGPLCSSFLSGRNAVQAAHCQPCPSRWLILAGESRIAWLYMLHNDFLMRLPRTAASYHPLLTQLTPVSSNHCLTHDDHDSLTAWLCSLTS